MKFKVIYYLSIACPTIQKTLNMVDAYVAHGATSFQIDMPSSDPYGETDFVKAQMENALKEHKNYDYYMNAFFQIRSAYPTMELHIVVYKDVIDAIGIEKFTDFCEEMNFTSVRLAGKDERDIYTKYLHAHGLTTIEGIDYYMTDEYMERAKHANNIITMRSKRKTEVPNEGMVSWEDRIHHVREYGITAPIFAVADMKSAADLEAAKAGGANGAIVGNVLMLLWDNETALWQKFNELQGCVE